MRACFAHVGSLVLYSGIVTTGVAALTLLWPSLLPVVGPMYAGAAIVVGAIVAIAALLLPAPLQSVSIPSTLLDRHLPQWQYGEHHELRIHAGPDAVYRALRAVTAERIRLFRVLTWIRAPRLSRGPESMLCPLPNQPILDVALRSGFVLLADEPPGEIALGAVLAGPGRTGVSSGEFAGLNGPGCVKAAMNFLLVGEEGGWTRISTETRVHAADATARRRFGIYWRFIFPGSYLIRLMWLQAVKKGVVAPA